MPKPKSATKPAQPVVFEVPQGMLTKLNLIASKNQKSLSEVIVEAINANKDLTISIPEKDVSKQIAVRMPHECREIIARIQRDNPHASRSEVIRAILENSLSRKRPSKSK